MSATLLARARDESGLTQSEVARRAGTSRPTLSAYEHAGRHQLWTPLNACSPLPGMSSRLSR